VTSGSKPAGGVLGITSSLAQTAMRQTLPFTGMPLWIVVLAGSALTAFGLTLRRSASALR
jgi:hypothetical protein